jgi:glutathione synthase/RimK-type ligase-like ATP-grasp enzyme
MKTILAIGDNKDFDSYQKFFRQRRLFREHGYYFKTVDYMSLLDGGLPQIKTKRIVVLLFFPFVYWEKNIETKESIEVYGTRDYFVRFRKFWKEVSKKLRDFYKEKDIYFVNLPEKLYTGRDKEATKGILSKAGIPVPKRYITRDYRKILEMENEGKKLFIKVRYGSMGKGITYLEKNSWLTNFRFKNNRIVSKKSDYGWTFTDITGNKKFLGGLLKQDVVVEDAVNPYLLKGRKFDLRIYIAFGKVLYIYPRSNEYHKITTNISQGGKGEDKHFLESIPPKILERAEKNALKAVKEMDLNFAGVDVLPDVDQNAIVLEVNTFPGFPSIKDRKRKFNLSKHLIAEITRHKWK